MEESKCEVVLIAGSDVAERLHARAAIEQAGLEACEVATGAEALISFVSDSPSMVVLDVDMAGLDGYRTCEELRRRRGSEHTPILVIARNGDAASMTRAFDAGATDFMTKPVNWGLFVHRVRYLLRSSRAFTDLQASQAHLATAQRLARLGSWEWDVQTGVMHWSTEVQQILGARSEDGRVQLETLLDLVHHEDRKAIREWFRRAAQGKFTADLEYRCMRIDGEELTIHQQAEAVTDVDGEVLRMSGFLQDISDRKRSEDRIRQLAYYDVLTGLPNRRFFKESLDRALRHARSSNKPLGLLFLDLDRFKMINDTLGHEAGDALLKEAGERLHTCVRSSDYVASARGGKMQTAISRIGGDEFTLLLRDLDDAHDAGRIASRILERFAQPFDIDGHEVFTSTSIGIAIHPIDGNDVDTLLRNADAAMYHAKDRGRNNFQFYTDAMNVKASRRLDIENNLRRAVQRGELSVVYQPKLDLESGEVNAVEALVRWDNAELGKVRPNEFIEVAEESGLIVPIGEWILRTACAQQRQWIDAGFEPIVMSVNLSSFQIRAQRFAEVLARVLQETGVAPEHVELEITESAIMRYEDLSIRTLAEIKQIGVGLALDDFGTGYSSLSYLKRFPIDALKIDRAFVRDVASDPDDAAITRAIVAMAQHLGLYVIAEGVETAEQESFLRDIGCDCLQGFRIGAPVSPNEAVTYLRRIG
ncbi:MAG: EAL domain-containing protein [Deltaproteobacteria bacterium]|nr:EAL domain-containing protein [Deltaproteobacteria bacterium]MBW2445759.1 EAL domain-containing protein [Deltaproteobacteria bacterium]